MKITVLTYLDDGETSQEYMERTLAVRGGLPLYGCDPALGYLGTKSGSRNVFRRAGVRMPPGYRLPSTLSEIRRTIRFSVFTSASNANMVRATGAYASSMRSISFPPIFPVARAIT